jgi:hypothetical protein
MSRDTCHYVVQPVTLNSATKLLVRHEVQVCNSLPDVPGFGLGEPYREPDFSAGPAKKPSMTRAPLGQHGRSSLRETSSVTRIGGPDRVGDVLDWQS